MYRRVSSDDVKSKHSVQRMTIWDIRNGPLSTMSMTLWWKDSHFSAVSFPSQPNKFECKLFGRWKMMLKIVLHAKLTTDFCPKNNTLIVKWLSGYSPKSRYFESLSRFSLAFVCVSAWKCLDSARFVFVHIIVKLIWIEPLWKRSLSLHFFSLVQSHNVRGNLDWQYRASNKNQS